MSGVVAAVVHERNGSLALCVEEVPEHSLASTEVRVRPTFVGICGSDLDQLSGKTDVSFGVQYPHILGHEWSGLVSETGSDVRSLNVGDHVVGHGSLGGNRWFGVSTDGAMAQSFAIPADMCFRVPSGVSPLNAALVEPLACSLTGLRKVGGVDPACEVLVTGLGAIGLGMVALAVTSGARVTALDPSPLRRSLAETLGAHTTVHPAEFVEHTSRLLPRGADLCVEASGREDAQILALTQAAAQGRVLLMGLAHGIANGIPMNLIQVKDLHLLSSTGAPAESWEPTLRLLRNTDLDLSCIVTDVFSLHDANKAIEIARDAANHGKVMVQINDF